MPFGVIRSGVVDDAHAQRESRKGGQVAWRRNNAGSVESTQGSYGWQPSLADSLYCGACLTRVRRPGLFRRLDFAETHVACYIIPRQTVVVLSAETLPM